ncbi:RNA polymerase sigma factor [Micromonospora taraxaci]
MPRVDTLPESSLVALAKAGSREAFGPLYRLYARQVYLYALAVTRGDQAAAEDVASEAWIDAMRRIDRYEDQGGGLVRWLVGLARYQAMTHYNRNRRHELPVGIMRDSDTAEQPEQPAENDAASRRRDELRARLYAAVDELPPKQQMVAKMRLDGMRDCEIVKVTGLSQKAASSNWYYAQRSLQNRLVAA